MASEEERQSIALEVDAFTEDAFAQSDASERLAFSRDLKGKEYDLSIAQSRELLQLAFNHADTKHDRADNLDKLVKYIGANFAKIVKITGFLLHWDTGFTNLQGEVNSIVDTLHNTGIDNAATLLNRVKALERNAITAGISEENEENLLDKITALTEKFRKFNTEFDLYDFQTINTKVEEAERVISVANPIETDTVVRRNITRLEDDLKRFEKNEKDLQALFTWKNSAAQMLQNIPQLKQEAQKDRNEARDILRKMQDLKVSIEELPGSQTVAKTTLGSAKIPELKSLDPTEFRTWRDLFNTHAKLQGWSEETKHGALRLAVPDPKVYVPLKLAAPDFDQISSEEILDKWEKRCCPDSHRDLAITQLSQLHQGLDEGSLQYIDRAVQLYIMAQFDSDERDPETDLQFIQRLINTFRDSRLKAPLRRRKPDSIAALRRALNEEMNILEDDPATATQVAAVSTPANATQVAAMDGKNSNVKKVLRCTFCGEAHDANKCRKTFALIQMMQKASASNSNNENRQDGNQNQRGGGNQRGRGRGGRGFRGRGRGRGYGGAPKRGNSDNPNGGNENQPPPKKEKYQDNQKN